MEDKVAITHQSYLVAVRFWPGFNEKFPFHEIEDLPFLGRDVETTLLAIRRVVASALMSSRHVIQKMRRKRAARWAEAIVASSNKRLGGGFVHSYSGSANSRELDIPRRCKLDRTLDVMTELGWTRHRGLRGGLPIASDRMPVIAVDNADLAQCIGDFLDTLEDEYLCKYFPKGVESILKAKGLTAGEFFCPRFSVISIAEMSAAERAVAICSLERLQSATEITFYSQIARAYQVEAERIAAAWPREAAGSRKDSTAPDLEPKSPIGGDDRQHGEEIQSIELTPKEIAIKLGIAEDTVAKKAKLAGVYREGARGKKYPLDEVREIAKVIADGGADFKLKERCNQFLTENPVGRDVG